MKKNLASVIMAVCVGSSAIAYDLSKDKVAYIVTDAHMDTQWLSDISQTISLYLPNTLSQNFALFAKYPGYVFNFEGAYRYWIVKQRYPADYAKLKAYIAAGNWAVAGGMVDMADVNIPCPEALLRQFLYGNGFFMDEFNKKSIHVMLPDNFGFSWALPTIASHCGMKGFSGTRVANCYPAISAPICRWEGPDGGSLVTIRKPGKYNTQHATPWTTIPTADGDATYANTNGAFWATWNYFGTGDIGGAPPDTCVRLLMARIADNPNQTIQVTNASSDQFFLDLTPAQINALPAYKTDFHLAWAGCWTSNGLMKLKNRTTEQRALAAEHAAVFATQYAQAAYPSLKLWLAWFRLCARGFHDDICGTSVAAADSFSYRQYDSCFAEFTQVLNNANSSVATLLDTRTPETGMVPIVLFNQLSIDRYDVVEADVNFGTAAPAGVQVFDQAGREVPSQVLSGSGQTANIALVAHVPAVSYSVYLVKPMATANAPTPTLTVNAAAGTLENRFYRVTVDDNGDISAILDKKTNQQLLSAPSRLEGRAQDRDAYSIYNYVMASMPLWSVDESVVKTVAENGPARVSLKIARTKDGSTYTQYVRLAADSAGNRVEVVNTVDWKSQHTLLSVSFPMTYPNPLATFDLGIGTYQRKSMNDDPYRYDQVAQQWADVTSLNAAYGLSINSSIIYARLVIDVPRDTTSPVRRIIANVNTGGFFFTVAGTNKRYAVDLPEVETISISDLRGRTVRVIRVPAGASEAVWDGRKTGGVYLVTFCGKNSRRTVKISVR